MKIYNNNQNDGKHIFVFGSNQELWSVAGIHGAGAALQAKAVWGAVQGVGTGRQGNSFAIPTKNRHLQTRCLDNIRDAVNYFLGYARLHPELTFLVTRIGCGLAGYADDDISPMFANAPANCDLPDGWEVTRGIRCFACRNCNYEWDMAASDHNSCETAFCPGCDSECAKCDSYPFAGLPCDEDGKLV